MLPSFFMKIIFALSLCLSISITNGQGLDNIWMFGYDNPSPQGGTWGFPWGGTNVDFNTGTPTNSYVVRSLDFYQTNSCISDSAGNLLFATNGNYVANAVDDTMSNGEDLNPGWYATQQFGTGLSIPQATLIIAKPGTDSIYYLFHTTIDSLVGTYSNPVSLHFYVTTINIKANNGLGEVLSKNVSLLEDTFNLGKISACKHANGRDWWVVCHKAYSKIFIKFLITPSGISTPYFQSIGKVRPPDNGQVCFSPDGSKFAYYFSLIGAEQGAAQIFDFDRCTGSFSNYYNLDISDSAWGACGVAFSPNSNLLYVLTGLHAYQFDLTATNINSTKYLVAEWDSFYSPPGYPFATTFNKAQLAADGKIYCSSSNSSLFLHAINNPDIIGSGCNINQHSYPVSTYMWAGLPNYPNYRLGPLPGSACDSLTGINNEASTIIFQVYPNPVTDHFTISYSLPSNEKGSLYLTNSLGQVILTEPLSPFTTSTVIDISNIATGIYNCIIHTKHSLNQKSISVVKDN
jgi:hypothetical protein